jgi:hypothetical protein
MRGPPFVSFGAALVTGRQERFQLQPLVLPQPSQT